MKTIIEQYIQFAIDNWYKENIIVWHCWYCVYEYKWYGIKFSSNLTELITSKEFIETIARGLTKKRYFPIMGKIDIEYITTGQAIAIRDCTLEEFITNLWILWQENKW